MECADELSLLIAVIVLLFFYDTFGSVKSLKCFSATACVLLLAHTIFNDCSGRTSVSFRWHVSVGTGYIGN